MIGQTLVLTLIALVTVALAPGVAALSGGLRRRVGLVWASLVAAVVAAVWAVYWAAVAQPPHFKHAFLFGGLAVVALVAASFSRPSEALGEA